MGEDNLKEIWRGDHLERRAEATYLGGFLLNRYHARKSEAGFVLAVNAAWGVGKTFMLTRWCDQLRHEGHPVVYFDAWANDFTPEPLIAFIAELNDGLAAQFNTMPVAKKKLSEWVKASQRVILPAVKAMGAVALKQASGIAIDKVVEAYEEESEVQAESGAIHKINGEKVAEQLSKAVGAALKEHINTRKAISACREKLTQLIQHLEKQGRCQLPIYVMVDELDRCRPDYAIELLEGIKHLFGVQGVYFVIGTNISELAHSISVVYGERFDSEGYLKRFFDLEYSLPDPDGVLFADDLLQGLIWRPGKDDLATGFLDPFWGGREMPDYLTYLFAVYSEGFGLSLRDQHGAMRILDAALQGLKGQRIHVHFLLYLVMLYQRSPTLYRKVVQHRGTENLSHEFNDLRRPPGAGAIKIMQLDQNQTFSVSKSVFIDQIGQRYLGYIRGGTFESQPNAYSFPGNLVADLPGGESGARSALSSYFDIVRRAGGFNNRPS